MQIGGSNAQLDMFEQTYIDVLLKSGHDAKAKPLLEHRSQLRPRAPVVFRQLASVYKVTLLVNTCCVRDL